MEQHKQIVESWVKLEKCLNDFDADVSKRQSKRPMSSAPAPNKFQINKKRPESSFKIGSLKNRPFTSSGQNPRPFSSATQIRPGTALSGAYGTKSSINQTFNFNKVINSLSLEEILALYEARCKDTQVDYLESQAKFFIDKFKISCVDNTFNFIEHNAGVISAKLISEILDQNVYFSKLELGKNNLGDEGLGWISKLVARNPNIIHLDVSSNSITEEGVLVLVDSLIGNNTLISLSLKSFEGLNRNKVGQKGCKHLKRLLQNSQVLKGLHQTLMYLNLCASQIGILGLKNICEGLRSNTSLLGLDISNNYLGPNACKNFAGTLSTSTLQELNLANNNLTNAGVQTLVPFLSRQSKSQIRKLNLMNNELTSAALPKLCESLQTNAYLEELILDQNNFSGVQVASLKNLLLETESLKILSLEKCFMDEFAAEAIKHGLTQNTSLVSLNLKGNSLYDNGFLFLCEALATNGRLKSIELADNRLRDKSGIAFGQVLKKNTGLEDVGLSGNAIAEAGGAAMVEGLLNNKVIKRIRLRLNPIGYKYMQEIEKLLDMNTKSQKKDFKPNIEGKIKELQVFETKRDSVFLEMERLEETLNEKRAELEQTKRLTQAAKNKETAITKEFEKEVEDAITYFNKLEEESHNIGKQTTEHRSNHRSNMDVSQRQKEFLEKDIQDLLGSIEEKKREFYQKDEEDKKKIEELKLAIAIEREKIEADLKKLFDLEKTYQNQLGYFNQSNPEATKQQEGGVQGKESEGTEVNQGTAEAGGGSKEGSALARQPSIKPSLQRGNTRNLSSQSPTKPKPTGGAAKPKLDGSSDSKASKPSASNEAKPTATTNKPTAPHTHIYTLTEVYWQHWVTEECGSHRGVLVTGVCGVWVKQSSLSNSLRAGNRLAPNPKPPPPRQSLPPTSPRTKDGRSCWTQLHFTCN